MISIVLNENDFEYDIYGLAKAFYPEEEIKVAPISGDFIRVDYATGEISAEVSIHGNASAGASPIISAADRKQTKNILKRLLYGLLSEVSGRSLPWGTLTGIRPTKIPTALIEEGRSDDEIRRSMAESYLISPEKLELSLKIAHREHELLAPIDYENGYSLYIGIPFCPTTCLYCSFTSFPIRKWQARVDTYLDCIEREMIFTSERMRTKKLQSIYIGGGTPTTLSEPQLERLLGMICKYYDTSCVREWTVEGGRPDSLTREKLSILHDSPVDRISINPQTMNEETLRVIGRHHTVLDTIEKFKIAREIGIDNINMDIILGLPGEGEAELRATLDAIGELGPDSLTVHSLAVKRAARLNTDLERYLNREYDAAFAMEMATQAALSMGMEPYYLYRQKNMTGNLENIGFARRGCEGIYNILIMEEKQTIVALGAGSVTKVVTPEGKSRIENVKDVNFYIDRIDEMIERKRCGLH